MIDIPAIGIPAGDKKKPPTDLNTILTQGGATDTATTDPGDIMSVIEQAIAHYRPEGQFATTRGEQLAEAKPKFVSEVESQLTSRGLAGTTMGGAIPAQFERTVAKPWRTETEMLRGQQLMNAILAKSGIMERAEARESGEALSREEMELRQLLASGQAELTREQMALQRELAMAELRAREGMAARQLSAGGAGGGTRTTGGGGGTTRTGIGGGGPFYAEPGGGYDGGGSGAFGGIPEGVMIGGQMYPVGTPSAETARTEETQSGFRWPISVQGVDVGPSYSAAAQPGVPSEPEQGTFAHAYWRAAYGGRSYDGGVVGA